MTNVAISMLFRYDEKYKSHNTNGLNRNIGCIEIISGIPLPEPDFC